MIRRATCAAANATADGPPPCPPSTEQRGGGNAGAGLGTLLALSFALLALAACSRDTTERQPLSVYAASSLTESFQELERAFEAANPDADVLLTLAGSQVLRLQIEQGARADVFASANPAHMEALVQQGLVSGSRVFAHNELVVVVPLDNPAGIASFDDLTRASRLVVGTANVPVGSYTREALRRATAELGAGFESAVLARVVSEEANVRLVRAKVELGEADAAVVYRTDAVPSERVRIVSIPASANVRADYLLGVVEPSRSRALATAWIAFVQGPEGREILARHGFLVE